MQTQAAGKNASTNIATKNTTEKTLKKSVAEAKQQADAVKHQVESGLAAATEQFGELKENFLKQCAAYTRQAEKQIRKRPLTAVALAAGLGLATMSLVVGAFKVKKPLV